jgi:hypothetical protein
MTVLGVPDVVVLKAEDAALQPASSHVDIGDEQKRNVKNAICATTP